MKTYFFTYLMHFVFKNSPYAECSKVHQSGKGWVAVIKDKEDGQEYLITAVPIESIKTVAPESADQLINMNNSGRVE